MATKQNKATTTVVQPQTPEQEDMRDLKSRREEINARIREATAQAKRDRDELKRLGTKTLAQVIEEQTAKVTLKNTERPRALAAQRIKAGATPEDAITGVLDMYRVFMLKALDDKLEAKAAQE